MAKISFISSDDRAYNVSRCLSLIKSEITGRIQKSNNIVIKVNCFSENYQLSATQVDALSALLEFISPHVKTQIVLAEATKEGDTLKSFQNYGYFNIQEKFDLAFVDLSKDDFEDLVIKDDHNHDCVIKIPVTLLHSDYIISITPPKTHSHLNYFGALANLVPSKQDPAESITRKERGKYLLPFRKKSIKSETDKYINLLHNIYANLSVSLSIIDGYAVMQGDGPGTKGSLSAEHWAIASTNFTQADILSCRLLGINPQNIEYLSSNVQEDSDLNNIIVGDEWKKHITKIKLHQNFQ